MDHDNEPFDEDPRDFCPCSRDDLERIWAETNSGMDRALHNQFFEADVMPPRCLECGGLIQQHSYADPDRKLAAIGLRASMGTENDMFADVSSRRNKNFARGDLVMNSVSSAAEAQSLRIQQAEKDRDVLPTIRATPDEQEHFRRGDPGPRGTDILRKTERVWAGYVAALVLIAAILMLIGFLVAEVITESNLVPVLGPVALLVLAMVLAFLPRRRRIEFDRGNREIRVVEQQLLCFCLAGETTIPFSCVSGIIVDPGLEIDHRLEVAAPGAEAVENFYDEDTNNNNTTRVPIPPRQQQQSLATSAQLSRPSNITEHDVLLCFSGTKDGKGMSAENAAATMGRGRSRANDHKGRQVARAGMGGTVLLETVETIASPTYQERWWLSYLRNDCEIGILTGKDEQAEWARKEEQKRHDAVLPGKWR